jgi:hypothetical protein
MVAVGVVGVAVAVAVKQLVVVMSGAAVWRARSARVSVPTVVYSGDGTFPRLPRSRLLYPTPCAA